MIRKLCLSICLCFIPYFAQAQALDAKQLLTLQSVKNVALQYPNNKGETFEKTMMAICLVETNAGKTKYGDKHLLRKGLKRGSYGIMQVQLRTARYVAQKFELWDVKQMDDITLIKKMMHDDVFNAKIATLYMRWLSEHSKSYFEMVSRYNGGKVNHPYYNKLKKNLRFLNAYKL